MHLLLVKTLNFKPSQDSFCETYRFEIPRQRITFFSLKKGKMKKRMTLKLVSTIFHCFWKNNVLFGYFEQNTLKRNLTDSCFIFPLFHKHLFSHELPGAARLLKTSCFEKITLYVIETMLVTLPLVQRNKARRKVNQQIKQKSR